MVRLERFELPDLIRAHSSSRISGHKAPIKTSLHENRMDM
jgi:hypothetical protein